MGTSEKNKTMNQYKHAKERFKKRYGREIEIEQIHALEDLTKQNKVRARAMTAFGNRDRVNIKIGDEDICFIFDNDAECIVTFIDEKEKPHNKRSAKNNIKFKNGNRRRCFGLLRT